MRTPRTTIGLFVVTALITLALASSPAGGQTAYMPTDLGTLGGSEAEAYAINDYAQIVGRSRDSGELPHAFHWQNAQMLDLNIEHWDRRILQQIYGVAYDMSNTGHAVGAEQGTPFLPVDELDDDVKGCASVQAIIYGPVTMSDSTTPYPGDQVTHLGVLPAPAAAAGGRSTATGVSPNGLYVVGWSDYDLNNRIHGFLVTPVNGAWADEGVTCGVANSLLQDLGTLQTQDENSSASAVNNHGQVVGWSYSASQGYMAVIVSPTVDGAGDPVDWFVDDGSGANSLMTSLGTLPSADGTTFGHNSWARAINDNAQVVGEADTGDFETHAFLWQSGTMIDLGTLGGANSSASGINDDGQVIGWSLDANASKRAFIITPVDTDDDGTPDQWYVDDDNDGANDLMVDLNTLLPSGFRIRLTEARDINVLGQIAGWGTVGTGDDTQAQAFLLTPTTVSADGDDDTDDGSDSSAAGSQDADLLPIEAEFQDSSTGDDTTGDTISIVPTFCGTGFFAMLPLTLAGLCCLRAGRRFAHR